MLLIPEEERELLEKVTKIATKAGQVVRSRARRFPSNIENVREIGRRAFLFGWLDDHEIGALLRNKGWKQ